jgi:arsenate reductase
MPRILILCTGNSARSQMAEALLESYDSGLEVRSAGTEPTGEVNPFAIRVMEEIGIDIAGARPKSVAQFLDQKFDYVITVCANAEETCPVFRGAVRRRLHFPFEDPAAARGTEQQKLEEFRRVRDQISIRFRDFYLGHIRAAMPKLRPARAADLDAVGRLLGKCGLGTEGLVMQFPDGYAVVESGGELIGAAGIEVYGEDGLLRSVAVKPEHQGTGAGALVVQDRIRWAAARHLRAVYLLTTGAVEFFERLCFNRIDRESAPEAIQASEQFRSACPASAALLCLPLR